MGSDAETFPSEHLNRLLQNPVVDRRRFMQLAGGTGAVLGLGPLIAACGSTTTGTSTPGGGSTTTIKIGYVSPETGSLAPFGVADKFVLNAIQNGPWKNGIKVGNSTVLVQLTVKDSQSSDSVAAQVALDLINNESIDLMLVSSTPDTTNPVSDQCEANGVPCISTVAPWQSWFFGRNGVPTKPFEWTYHFFWGLEDIITTYFDMWSQVSSDKVVGALWPNDPDGNAFSSAMTGFPPAIKSNGFTLVDPGRYATATPDFTQEINKFKAGNCDILTGVPIPPDFNTFWKQAAQQGYKPKIATVAKALLFPDTINALGSIAAGLSTEVWWTPTFPYTSSITGQSAAQLAAAYTQSTGKQWTQPIGYVHALLEVATDVIKRAGNVTDPAALTTAIKATNLKTIVGTVDWTGGPVANVAKTKQVGGQWRPGTDYPFDLIVVSNKDNADVPLGGSLQPMA
jgi:branched-chain amino acid transport system substrate-binding protein